MAVSPLRALLTRRLRSQRPVLYGVMKRHLLTLTDGEVLRLASANDLRTVWAESGLLQLYEFGVEPADIPPSPDSTTTGGLSDAALDLVRAGRHGRAALALRIAHYAATGSARVANAASLIRNDPRLRTGPLREGLVRVARQIAAADQSHRGPRDVLPEDLIAALALGLLPSLRGALGATGVDASALIETGRHFLATEDHEAVGRFRAMLFFPENLVRALYPDTSDAEPALRLRWPSAELQELDADWLIQQFLINARGPVPAAPRTRERPSNQQSFHAVVARGAADGWEGVFTAALRTAGWADSIARTQKRRVEDVVARALSRASRQAATRLPQTSGEPRNDVDVARAEFADVRTLLSQRHLHPSLVDYAAYIAFAHRRGVATRLLLTGPTGSGKTFLARAIAEVAGCPFFLQDSTNITETGYRGLNTPELVEMMYRNAGSDLEALQRSVLVLDEIEKLRVTPGVDGVSLDKRMGVQWAMLQIVEGSTPINCSESRISVRTSGMLIIATGAFSDAEWSAIRPPTTDDLVAYGLTRELGERLRERVLMPSRSRIDLVRMLSMGEQSAESVVAPVARALGFELHIDPGVYTLTASLIERSVGGTGIRSGGQMVISAAQRALVRALMATDSDNVIRVTPDDLSLPNLRDYP